MHWLSHILFLSLSYTHSYLAIVFQHKRIFLDVFTSEQPMTLLPSLSNLNIAPRFPLETAILAVIFAQRTCGGLIIAHTHTYRERFV
jgi:hypothetical protein